MQSTPHAFVSPYVPDVAACLEAVGRMAKGEGVTLTPLPRVWIVKFSQAAPYYRGRNAGTSLAIAASGTKLVSVENERFVNDASRFLVLHGERPYDAVVEGSEEEPYIALKLQLPPELVAKTLIEYAETGYSQPQADMTIPAFCDVLTPDLATSLLRLIRALDDPADCLMLAPSYLREICYRLLRSEAAGVLRASITSDDVKLVRAMRFIEEGASSRLTVADVAAEVAMSPSHFAHRFRTCVGVSPMRYRAQVRLERARLLLLNTAATVSRAAEEAGYASDAHFSRDFKELFGVSPRAYVRDMQALFGHGG
ncbi:AraC family transcriptional regulator (plasmid) [Rhizobium sp. 32-5/1]|uniref:AraC family transcriptional regulator n=1 Tax=Rhizobium sp. 32-5/1 TaxID=3019602 RepID=UPI00240D9B08|nr:AraC family transcriptional regulator [Rhizobium sp. 32-5/1]WEZ85426.1 AraC family transcriptional regulator [Rhizobium sp. 32-5/1]